MISAVSAPFVQSFPPPTSSSAGRSSARLNVEATAENTSSVTGQLTDEEKAVVEQLKKVDQEVRTHEQAHKNAGGKFAGAASFGFDVGPDGKRYAISGEVPIDIAPVEGDPEATIAKMITVANAALAPAKPSAQDRQVAAQASAIRAEAQAELTRESRLELTGEEGAAPENVNARSISAIAAYEAGTVPENSEKISGNILDFLS